MNWFHSFDDTYLHPAVYHTTFFQQQHDHTNDDDNNGRGGVRGLGWNMTTTTMNPPFVNNNQQKIVITKVPASIVLSTDYYYSSSSSSTETNLKKNDNKKKKNWDCILAMKLWNEILLGTRSKYYGYCSLLTSGSTTLMKQKKNDDIDNNDTIFVVNPTFVPPSTAPDTIRNWTPTQREDYLNNKQSNHNTKGQQLIQLYEKQNATWYQQYQMVLHEQHQQQDTTKTMNIITWEQFQWAMETVNSRAFQGLQTNQNVLFLPLPVLVALVTIPNVITFMISFFQLTFLPDWMIFGTLFITTVPLLCWNIYQNVILDSTTLSTVALLPIVDSANHINSADSSIEYDPWSNCFELKIQTSTCLMKESDQKIQLYVTYGNKSDMEFLLNYGFLPQITTTSTTTTGDKNDEDGTKTNMFYVDDNNTINDDDDDFKNKNNNNNEDRRRKHLAEQFHQRNGGGS